jgi:hypothetical protein
MKRATKILIVSICGLLCTGGAILSLKEGATENRAKTKMLPINNRAKESRVWTWS